MPQCKHLLKFVALCVPLSLSLSVLLLYIISVAHSQHSNYHSAAKIAFRYVFKNTLVVCLRGCSIHVAAEAATRVVDFTFVTQTASKEGKMINWDYS